MLKTAFAHVSLAVMVTLGVLVAVLAVAGPVNAAPAVPLAPAATPVPVPAVAPVPAPGGMVVEASSAVYPDGVAPLLHVRLTNGGVTCALAATPDLTVSILGVTRDGQPVTPGFVRRLPIDGAAAALAARTHSVPAGQQLTFDLDTGPDQALPASIALPDGSELVTLWPVRDHGRYQVRLAYAMPPSAAAGACAGISDAVTVGFTVGSSAGFPWLLLIVVVGAVLLLVAALVLILRHRRGRKSTVAAAAVLVLLAGVGAVATVGLDVTPASAGVIYGPAQQSGPIYDIYSACINKIVSSDPGLLNKLGGHQVSVYPWTETDTRPSPSGVDGDSMIRWDPYDTSPFLDEPSGAAADPCASLYHELQHALDRANDADSSQPCDDTGILVDEVRATLKENQYRAKNGLPARTTYDGKKLPGSLDDCVPPKLPPDQRRASNDPGVCRGLDGPCGRDNGDPHLTTFDGAHFDLQAVGEFVAVKSAAGVPPSTGDMEIQVRQRAYPGSREVSINSAVALKVGAVKLGFYLEQSGVVVHRDGAVVAIPTGTTTLAGGAKINRVTDPVRGDSYAVVWPDGSVAWVEQTGPWGLLLTVQPRAARSGSLTGLFGPYNGDKTDDVSTVDGQKLATPVAFDQLYHTYAPGWRVTGSNSLFDYDPGKSTKDYTDVTFPDRPTVVTPSAHAAATVACGLLGVTAADLLADCVLDVATTGQAQFAVTAGDSQALAGGGGTTTGGTTTGGGSTTTRTLQINSTGASASFPLDGTAGQRVYIDVPSTTLPDACGVPTLVAPAGNDIGIGCLKGGKGFVDGTLLPVTGRYQILVKPPGGATGTITVRVIVSTDAVVPLTPDGPAATGTVGSAGAQARLTFTATAGEKVFVDILASTLPAACGGINIVGPSNVDIGIGCTVAGGTGLIDTTTLTTAGPYAVLLDPTGDATGSATVKLTVVNDQVQPIVLNGPAVLATVAEAGASSRLTFTGAAGQHITITGTGATLPAGCGIPVLIGPAGNEVDEGCIDAAGTVNFPATLAAAGDYTIVVDPSDRHTGSVSLRLAG